MNKKIAIDKAFSYDKFKKIINEFLNNKDYPIYNEVSLQYQLGKYLKKYLKENVKDSKDYKVEFERNIEIFGVKNKADFANLKHEIDICIYSDNAKLNERIAVELKYPSIRTIYNEDNHYTYKCNGAYPDTYNHMIEDIIFMSAVGDNTKLSKPFTKTYCITVVNDVAKNYYTIATKGDKAKDDKYYAFRRYANEELLDIDKRNAKFKEIVNKKYLDYHIKDKFDKNLEWINWKKNNDKGKYYIIEPKDTK